MTKIIAIAKVCHEANRALCEAFGDTSQKSWDDAPEWQRESAISGVTFHLNNPGAGPESSHVEWMRHKAADGWVYGPVKDEGKKEHPCMVPYEQLPPEQRAKDYVFRAIVHAYAERPVAKHYLDPKQTEGPQDVEIGGPNEFTEQYWWFVPATNAVSPPCYATEAEALTAARKAAGYETEE